MPPGVLVLSQNVPYSKALPKVALAKYRTVERDGLIWMAWEGDDALTWWPPKVPCASARSGQPACSPCSPCSAPLKAGANSTEV